jgi:urocanate hydratase
MKTFAAIAVALLVGSAESFMAQSLSSTRSSQLVSYGYVPSGFTPEQYKKLKEDDAKKLSKSNLGGVGPRGKNRGSELKNLRSDSR